MKKDLMRVKAAVMVILAFALAFALGCGQPAAPPSAPAVATPTTVPAAKAEAPKTQRVTITSPSRSVFSLPFDFGAEKGLYKEEGLEVKSVVMKGAISVSGLVSGDVDYTSAATSVIRGAILGLPAKKFMHTLSQGPWYLFVSPDIGSVKDLKGKTMGVPGRGGSTDVIGKRVLEHYGLDPDKELTRVDLVDLTNVFAAMKAGRIQGAIFSPPWDSLAKKEGFKNLLWTGEVVDMAAGGLATTDKKLKDNPDQVKRVIKATIKSLRYVTDEKNREEILRYIMKEFNADRATAEDTYATILKTYTRDGGASENSVQAEVEFAKNEAGFKGDVPLSRVVDHTLLVEVQKELKLK